MKKRLIAIVLITCTTIIVMSIFNACTSTLEKSSSTSKLTFTQDTLHLLEGDPLKTFDFVMKQKNVDAKTLFTYEKKLLNLTTNEAGYLRTKQSFNNYKLHIEWRWPQGMSGANSGILIHTQQPDSVWPKCVQVQLKQEKAGDLIAMAGAKAKETEGKLKDTTEKFETSNEKTAGEWNFCDVVCANDSMTVYVNGLLQNKVSGMNINNGTIGFQLEGKPISFRSIYLIIL
jgi:hypothetical protein